MPRSYHEESKNDRAKPDSPVQPSVQDIPGVGEGGGAARRAGEAMVKDTARKKARLDDIMGTIKKQR